MHLQLGLRGAKLKKKEGEGRKADSAQLRGNSIFQLEDNLRLYLDNEIENSFRYSFVFLLPLVHLVPFRPARTFPNVYIYVEIDKF